MACSGVTRRPAIVRKRPSLRHAELYRERHRMGIIFGRLKDWRRIPMRYDRSAHTLPATVTFWLGQ